MVSPSDFVASTSRSPHHLFFLVSAATSGPLTGLFKLGMAESFSLRSRQHRKRWGELDLRRSALLRGCDQREAYHLGSVLRDAFGTPDLESAAKPTNAHQCWSYRADGFLPARRGLCGAEAAALGTLVFGRSAAKNSVAVSPNTAAMRSMLLARTSLAHHSMRWYHFRSVSSRAATCSWVSLWRARSSRRRAAMNSIRAIPHALWIGPALTVSYRTPLLLLLRV